MNYDVPREDCEHPVERVETFRGKTGFRVICRACGAASMPRQTIPGAVRSLNRKLTLKK